MNVHIAIRVILSIVLLLVSVKFCNEAQELRETANSLQHGELFRGDGWSDGAVVTEDQWQAMIDEVRKRNPEHIEDYAR